MKALFILLALTCAAAGQTLRWSYTITGTSNGHPAFTTMDWAGDGRGGLVYCWVGDPRDDIHLTWLNARGKLVGETSLIIGQPGSEAWLSRVTPLTFTVEEVARNSPEYPPGYIFGRWRRGARGLKYKDLPYPSGSILPRAPDRDRGRWGFFTFNYFDGGVTIRRYSNR